MRICRWTVNRVTDNLTELIIATRRPEEQASLILANRDVIADLLDQGSVIVFEEARLRSRTLPILRGGKM